MSVYYNEIDPYCAAWLQNLMDAGHIPQGVIDTRSIEDVRPDELAGFTQCHFFAGLGGWAYALQLAGWGTRPVWTGSCPCQPFSAAGKGAGFADERHLWPAWQHLIAQCRPPVVFGEQVASKDADAWIDLVHADLEGMGYAFGCVPFPAAGVGAPHIRDRNYWVADAWGGRFKAVEQYRSMAPTQCGEGIAGHSSALASVDSCQSCRLADTDGRNASAERQQRGGEQRLGADGRLADANIGSGEQRRAVNRGRHTGGNAKPRARLGGDGMPDSLHLPEGMRLRMPGAGNWSSAGQHGVPCPQPLSEASAGLPVAQWPSPLYGFWRDADWLFCTDGKWRPVEPGTSPLAHGIPNRVGRLRAYGNAIVPQAAQAFIESYCEAIDALSLA